MRVAVVSAHPEGSRADQVARRPAAATAAAGVEIVILVSSWRPGTDVPAGPGQVELVHVHGDVDPPATPFVASADAPVDGARLTLVPSLAAARGYGDRVRAVQTGIDIPAGDGLHHPGRILSPGPLTPEARHQDVVRALWLLRDRHPDAHLLVAGDGPERPRLERLVRDLDLMERVELCDDAGLAEAAVFVRPSIDERRRRPYVEAMAAGIPAVAGRGEPGPEEIARLGDGLCLVAPGDPEDLARTLSGLLADDRERRRLGAAARATVQAHFTWEACGRATVAAYRDALRA